MSFARGTLRPPSFVPQLFFYKWVTRKHERQLERLKMKRVERVERALRLEQKMKAKEDLKVKKLEEIGAEAEPAWMRESAAGDGGEIVCEGQGDGGGRAGGTGEGSAPGGCCPGASPATSAPVGGGGGGGGGLGPLSRPLLKGGPTGVGGGGGWDP